MEEKPDCPSKYSELEKGALKIEIVKYPAGKQETPSASKDSISPETLGSVNLDIPSPASPKEPLWEHIPDDSGRFSWCFCLVFAIGNAKVDLGGSVNADGVKRKMFAKRSSVLQTDFFALKIHKTLKALRKSGLQYTTYKSVQEDEVYCLIGITEDRCRQEAARIHFDMQLDPVKALIMHLKSIVGWLRQQSLMPGRIACVKKITGNIFT
eukprot:694051_1